MALQCQFVSFIILLLAKVRLVLLWLVLTIALLGFRDDSCSILEDVVCEPVVVELVAVRQPLAAPVVQHSQLRQPVALDLDGAGDPPRLEGVPKGFDRTTDRCPGRVYIVEGVGELGVEEDGGLDLVEGGRCHTPRGRQRGAADLSGAEG